MVRYPERYNSGTHMLAVNNYVIRLKAHHQEEIIPETGNLVNCPGECEVMDLSGKTTANTLLEQHNP